MEGLREGKRLGFSHPASKYNALGMILLLGFTDTGMRAQMRKTSGWRWWGILDLGLVRENSGIRKDCAVAAADSAWYPAWKRIMG